MPTGVYPRTEKHTAQIAEARKRRWEIGARTWSIADDKKHPGLCRNTGRTHFKKGESSWNAGKKEWMSEEHKVKLSQINAGKTPWNKGLYGWNGGESNPNWKGGVNTINNRLRRTKKYAQWRKSVFERDNYACQFCGIRGVELNADHIKPFAFFPELRFDTENGRTLCVECHKTTPTYKNHKYQEVN